MPAEKESKSMPLGTAITIASGIVISVFSWGMTVEKGNAVRDLRIDTNTKNIENINTKRDTDNARIFLKLEEINIKMQEGMEEIRLQLKDKADRDGNK